jgi:hypothetical protein
LLSLSLSANHQSKLQGAHTNTVLNHAPVDGLAMQSSMVNKRPVWPSSAQANSIYSIWSIFENDSNLRATGEIGPWNSKMVLALLAQTINM